MVELAVLAFLHKSIEEGYEGIMVKTIDEKLSHYDGKTRTLWTKVSPYFEKSKKNQLIFKYFIKNHLYFSNS